MSAFSQLGVVTRRLRFDQLALWHARQADPAAFSLARYAFEHGFAVTPSMLALESDEVRRELEPKINNSNSSSSDSNNSVATLGEGGEQCSTNADTVVAATAASSSATAVSVDNAAADGGAAETKKAKRARRNGGSAMAALDAPAVSVPAEALAWLDTHVYCHFPQWYYRHWTQPAAADETAEQASSALPSRRKLSSAGEIARDGMRGIAAARDAALLVDEETAATEHKGSD